MTDANAGVSRRGFLRTAAGGAAVASVAGTAAGQENGPSFDGYLDDVENYDGSVVDATGQDEVTVEVGVDANGGAFGFGPAAIRIDNGATVKFEWTGNGGGHNVVAESGAFDSGDPVAEAGVNFEHTFEEDGVYKYFCAPHKSLEMKGGIVVGSAGGGGGGGESSGGGGGGGGTPDFGGYLDNVENFDGSVVDEQGNSEVTVEVGVDANGGAFGFGPAAVHVDNGATVKFEWTGNGGGHNVVAEDGTFDSGDPVSQAGVNFEYTFEEDGVYNYFCAPHKSLEMKGAIVVGSDYPTTGGGGGGGDGGEGGGGGGGPALSNSAKSIGVATSFVMVATLGLAYFFMKYGGDYDTPE